MMRRRKGRTSRGWMFDEPSEGLTLHYDASTFLLFILFG